MSHHSHKRQSQTLPPASHRRGSRGNDVWLQLVDGGLAGVIFLVPLLMGGRHPLGQLVLVFLAVVTAAAWIIHQWRSKRATWRPMWAALLLIAAAALALLQILPLPDALLQRLDPRLAGILPLWHSALSSAGGLGGWSCISLTPADTGIGLALFLAYGLLFVVVVQRTSGVEDVERMMRWCGLAALGMAVFGLVQFFAGNGKFFWFYQHPFTNTAHAVKGSFSNRNHFAQFLAFGMGPLIWWLQDTARRAHDRLPVAAAAAGGAARRHELHMYLLGLAMAVVVFANLLSLSRGGIVAALIACTVCTTVCYRASAVGGKVLAGLAAAALVIAAALSVSGYDQLVNRLDGLLTGSLEKLDGGRGRRDIWAAALRAIPDHAIVGAGVGSFQEVYPTYGDAGIDAGVEYTHAESGLLQVPVELGGAGIVLLLAGMVWCANWCFRGCSAAAPARLRLCAGAGAASLAAFAAHGTVDFVWYVPACAAQAAILAGCALRISQWTGPVAERKPATLPRWAPAAAALALASLGVWMIAACVGPAMAAPYWDQYLLALDAPHADPQAADRHEAVPAGAQISAREEEMIAVLENVVDWQPDHFRAQLALAELHLRQFEELQTHGLNPMSLVNVRDAVLQSRFPSPEAMVAWLSRAIGNHWIHLQRALFHARQAVTSCPLEGRAYIYLARLDFLDSRGGLAMQDCVKQALRVRPFDGAVLYAAASEAYLAGDSATWLEYAKRAFHSGRAYQRQLIVDLLRYTTPAATPAMAAFLVREFQPDLEGVRFLATTCAKVCGPEQLVPLRRYWAEMAEREAQTTKEPDSVGPWLESLHVYLQLKDATRALDCARHAVKSDPNHYRARYELAACLIEHKDFAEAETQLHWCLQRSPNDRAAELKLKQALQGRLDGERSASAGGENWR